VGPSAWELFEEAMKFDPEARATLLGLLIECIEFQALAGHGSSATGRHGDLL
jgi:hypothetical protein